MKRVYYNRTGQPAVCTVISAAYQSGRMLSASAIPVALDAPEKSLRVSLNNCAGATDVKVFVLSENCVPLGMASMPRHRDAVIGEEKGIVISK